MPLEELQVALPARYRLIREIGRGGMAVVYLAEDVPHGRDVAVKVLSPELTSSIDGERFRREIQIAARLSHPNILPAYDSGSADGLLFYVMPFIQGESLRARLDRESQLPIEEAIAITCEVADALAYAHSQGVVHRDIKPENILIQSGHAVVADFGIARLVQDVGAEKLTQTGMSIGTAAYMSPEQFTGEKVDGRSDVYALACVLYEMLVGQVPFTGPNAMAIMARHTMQAVPSIRVVRSSVPEDVEAVIVHALEKTPADRFATVDEFKDALLSGNPGMSSTFARSTPMYTAAYRAAHGRRGWNRRRSMMGVAASVLVIAGTVVAAKAFFSPPSALSAGDVNRDADSRHVGVLYFADESKDGSLRFLADGLTESLIDELSRVPALDVVSKNGVRLFRGVPYETAQDSIQRTLNVGTVVRGEVESSKTGARVTVRLVDAVSGVEIKSEKFDVDTANVLAAQGELSKHVAEFLRKHLGDEVKLKSARQGSSNSEAWTLVQRAEKRRKDADSLAKQGAVETATQLLGDAELQLARAERLDPSWVQPPMVRAMISFQRARAQRAQPVLAAASIDSGLAHVARALAVDPRSADALEYRGKLQYLRIELQLLNEGPDYNRTLERAEDDLRAAVDQNPSQAGAWVTLSSLAYNKHNVQEALNAAQKAYAADAYLANARDVLRRLFWTSHDMEQFPEAGKWCAEGHRRFPRDLPFVECQLWMLTTKARRADPDEAWRLVDSMRVRTPAKDTAKTDRHARIITAAVLARAGLKDSARAVLVRARGTPDIDPEHELVGDEAIARVFLKDYDEAVRLLESYLAANPQHRKGFATKTSLWWKDATLQAHPRFKALIAGAR
ncbi:MAG: serine/threonine-protein kinase [Gemmatimonadaceae bacterium]|nr:serine/threonine-protein kinase [Gemmatimonadaceae bacterium]